MLLEELKLKTLLNDGLNLLASLFEVAANLNQRLADGVRGVRS